MAYYEIEVKFHDDSANVVQQERYYKFLSIYGAVGIGHKRTETSTVNMSSETELTQSELERFLGEDIPIISFKKIE